MKKISSLIAIAVLSAGAMYGQQNFVTSSGELAGLTYYDNQTNAATRSQIVHFKDGGKAIVYIYKNDVNTSSIGYNYFNPSTGKWKIEIPTTPTAADLTNITPVHIGSMYPDLHKWNEDSVLIVSNNFESPAKVFITKGKKDGSNFSTIVKTFDPGLIFIQAAVGGKTTKTIHIVGSTDEAGTAYEGQTVALFYSKSTDGGNNWTTLRLPETDTTHYATMNEEAYKIVAKGDTVVIAVGGMSNDVLLYKSLDNGNSWTKTVVYKNKLAGPPTFLASPLPHVSQKKGRNHYKDIPAWTALHALDYAGYNNDSQIDVAIDNNGKIHFVFPLVVSYNDNTIDKTFSTLYENDILVYWNEGMLVKKDSVLVIGDMSVADVDGVVNEQNVLIIRNKEGSGYYKGRSIFLQPNIGVGKDNSLYILFSCMVENEGSYDYITYSNIFATKNDNNGGKWSQPKRVVAHPKRELVFPSLWKEINDKLHIVYQHDDYQGLSEVSIGTNSTEPKHNKTINKIYYKAISTSLEEVNLSISTLDKNIMNDNIKLYPNPSSGSVSIIYNLKKSSDLKIKIVNTLGQVIYEQEEKNINPQSNFTFNTEQFQPGVYFVQSIIGNYVYSNKLIINK